MTPGARARGVRAAFVLAVAGAFGAGPLAIADAAAQQNSREAERRLERVRKVYEAKRRDVEKHPLVVELLERFGGTLGAIEVEDDRYSS